ncbi:acetyl-CoA hydrolase/transferase C-terminal domain-containing protein (plasmid) [Nocardioides sp. R1-1]|uniref:acetyl-CoA hydrolase/transferase C-terminal domain-containing protein n=1 Tax=Nocardioides sp. R1-1 TaxID=3383502 RepID=UPI0038CFBCA2
MLFQTPERAAARLLRGLDRATVLVGMGERLPDVLVAAVIREARARRVRLTLLVADIGGRWAFIDQDALADVRSGALQLRLLAGGVPPALAPRVGHVAGSMFEVDRMIATGELPVDAYVARVGLGSGGRLTFGSIVGYGPTALEVADRVGFEVVEEGPWPRFVGEIDVDPLVVTAAVRVESSPDPVTPRSAPTDEQRLVARTIARLIPDGATLQTGLGAVPAALLPELAQHADLGVHSGILPAELRALIAAGVVTGSRKSDAPGRHVATGVKGGTLDPWGPDVSLQPIAQTHNPDRLRSIDHLWAVNSAYEIDLAGQVNAEWVRGRRVASGGGQIDFLRAARMSAGGAAVLALPARTSRGQSRIVARLSPAQPPTSTWADLDVVVTDHGVADLRGLSFTERAEAVVRIAHPDDRRALGRASAELDVDSESLQPYI